MTRFRSASQGGAMTQVGAVSQGGAMTRVGSVRQGAEVLPSRRRLVMGRLGRHPGVLVGGGLLLALSLLAFLGPLLARWPWDSTDFTAFRDPPSAEHWFGTTASGRDVYALTLHGMQKSLLIGLGVAVFATGLAALVGAFAGYLGGWADRGLMALTDLLLVLPALLLVAVAEPATSGHWPMLIPLLSGVLWMVTARIVRGMTRSLKERDFVLAARYMGVSAPRVILRHILPHLAALLIVDATLNVSAAVIGESSLSYFGLGVQPPDTSLGTILADGSGTATVYPWLFVPPAGLLVLIVLAVNLLGDGLRDALDPSSARQEHL